ncbi:hypothetical protein MOV40_06420 [Bifidobacterium pseudolongum subsp. globosum]|nr:hypothetical protein [Bifidobacterium pseudolongum]MCI1195130.1 hypothetical protein [Bifidobacterium pseudolongum subsp. globosum]RYQ06013.1 cell filamentation protein Fic [Bifidobacterium pseudolongum subsp. globosum]UNZ09493.1 hypothetical protein MRS62_07770 [Bifidobacterium pseudolongum subsp. globosum]
MEERNGMEMKVDGRDLKPDRARSVELAKRLLVDPIWKTANIEVDGIAFPDTQEIVEGRAPADMTVDGIVTVNNIKHAWQFLLDNVDYPVDWQYVAEYNRIIGVRNHADSPHTEPGVRDTEKLESMARKW